MHIRMYACLLAFRWGQYAVQIGNDLAKFYTSTILPWNMRDACMFAISTGRSRRGDPYPAVSQLAQNHVLSKKKKKVTASEFFMFDFFKKLILQINSWKITCFRLFSRCQTPWPVWLGEFSGGIESLDGWSY